MQIAHEIGSRNNAFCVLRIFHSAMIVKPVQLLFPFTYLSHLQQTNYLILEQYLLNIMPIPSKARNLIFRLLRDFDICDDRKGIH